VTCPLAARAATTALYVDKTASACSDSGPGTATTPYCTVVKGVSKLAAGVTLYIGDGTYGETVKPTVSGTSGAGQLVSGKTAYGISVRGSTTSVVSGNNVHDNHGTGILLTSGSTGIVVAGNSSSFNAEGFRRNANGINVISPGKYEVLNNVAVDNAVYPAYQGISCSRRARQPSTGPTREHPVKSRRTWTGTRASTIRRPPTRSPRVPGGTTTWERTSTSPDHDR
jgi:parallel beta-helix repeat protein